MCANIEFIIFPAWAGGETCASIVLYAPSNLKKNDKC